MESDLEGIQGRLAKLEHQGRRHSQLGTMALSVLAVLLACLSTGFAQQKSLPAPRKAITASNFRWTTYQNGWVDLSFSLRNNAKIDVTKVQYRVIFLDQKVEPIHFEEGFAGRIPTGLAVMETVKLMDGGLNIYHSTAHLRVDILSYDEDQHGGEAR